MLHLIPMVKNASVRDGFLFRKAVCYDGAPLDSRILAAVRKLPQSAEGAILKISVTGTEGEGYTLDVDEKVIAIVGESPASAFYGVQTLRQLFRQEQVPCLHIEDKPDFSYRGFYHDVTRGKIPTVETVKKLIDQMAYYKLNSLQLYVEHTFAFEEYKQLNEKFGCLTKEEMLEIGAYCRENFIDFIPSLSTFGHLYELLEQPQYQHLRVLKDYKTEPNFWRSRMRHHTLDPKKDESIALVQSLIDQYMPFFESDWFNICCDETFDLHSLDAQGRLYVEFVKKIIALVKARGKKVMMWADILLKYPQTIAEIPDDICFLNWSYRADPSEEQIIRFAESGRKQILCPGTTSWSRLCENVAVEEQNICKMAEYGYRHGAEGILNTNWGDFANPCSLELAMYGLVLGAEKSWSVKTATDDAFYSRVNSLLYETENGIDYLKELSDLHALVDWNQFCAYYFYRRYGQETDGKDIRPDVDAIQKGYESLAKKLSAEIWTKDEYRQEMLLAAEGLCVVAELWCKLRFEPVSRRTDTLKWLERYSEKWQQKNKRDELYRIREMFAYCEEFAEAAGGDI